MMDKNPIYNLYEIMDNSVKNNNQLIRQLYIKLQKIVSYIQMEFIKNHEKGYCSRFIIPDKDINLILSDFPELTDDVINKAFNIGWGLPPNVDAHMHSNVYYQKLCLITYFAVKHNNKEIGELAIRLILFRIWNGRITKLIKFCRPDIMAAAIANCKSMRFGFKKYATPLDLIQQYYAPTIYDKYKDYLLKDVVETKRLFEQCFGRIKQLFGSGSKPDLETGKVKYQSGLQPFYYSAYEQQQKIKQSNGEGIDDNVSNVYGIIDNIITQITVSQNVYSDEFVNFIKQQIIGIKKEKVLEILKAIHQLKYSDLLRDILELYFRRLKGITKKDFCSDKFYDLIDDKIVSSKNNQEIIHLKQLVDKLLDNIFKNDLSKKYDNFLDKSNNQKNQYKIIIYYGIGLNIKQNICGEI